VPAAADSGGDALDAVTLALALAGAEARCANRLRALAAFEAALALQPGAGGPPARARGAAARDGCAAVIVG